MKKTKLFRRVAVFIMTSIISSLFPCLIANAASEGPSSAEITYYEAEKAERTGDLWEGNFSLASGGKVITQISKSNHITFNVKVPEAGEYDIQVHYATYNKYAFKFIINDNEQEPVTFECPSNYSWGENPFGLITTSAILNKGINTIKLTSDVASNTDTRFDRIGILKAKPKHNADVVLTGEAKPPAHEDVMWYRSPAEKWAESLPLGNGRIGAMIWGGVYEDVVSLNEVTCWSGEDHADKGIDNPEGPEYLAKIREEFQKPNPDRAAISEYFKLMGGKTNDGFGTSRPFGVLKFNFNYEGNEISEYIRSLDLSESMSYVNYTANGVDYLREAFVSNPDQVMVMKYSASESERISFDVNFALEEPAGGNAVVTAENDILVFKGRPAAKSSMDTYARLKAIPVGGDISYDEYGIHISGADEVVLILALGTTFDDNDAVSACAKQLEAAAVKDYSSLKADHINDVKPRFERMSIQLGESGENIPTDERVENIRNGEEPDSDFIRLWYQYSRYLMLAGSRENSPLPMHLQGIWNDNVSCNMIWNCDYHLDINIQMNQWMSNASNLSEGEKPIFRFMRDYLIPSGKVTAQTQYGASGWTVGIVTNPWGYSGNTGTIGAWEGSTTSGAWLAQEIMNYFGHTWDIEFLENEGLPMLKETADFFLDYLVEYSQDINPADGRGYLVTIPGSSPENGDLEVMPAYDRTMIYDIFYQVLRSYDILSLPHDEYYERVDEALNRLAPYKISKFGQLAEWPYNDNTDGASEHRTTSNLLGVFPYDQITPDKTPELARAALLSMDRKFELPAFEHTEWTCVNAQGMYARFKDGEKAFSYLKRLASVFTWPNLMSISPEGIGGAETDVYIIDGVLGMAAGVNEMLLQSHSERLEFLPALPNAWEQGEIQGMVGRGAFEVDFKWDDYKLSYAKIKSNAGNKCRIYLNNAANWSNTVVWVDNGDGSFTPVDTVIEDNCMVFDTVQGAVYTLKSKDNMDLPTGHLINDTHPDIVWQGFTPNAQRGLGDYLDDAHYAQGTGASFELQFEGTGIDLITEAHSTSEKVEIWIDDTSMGVHSAYSPERKAQHILYSIDGLEYGKHKIKGVTKSDSADEQYLEIDAFAVHGYYASYQNDDSPQIEYSGEWQHLKNRHESNISAYCDDVHFTAAEGAAAEFTFNGTGVELIGEKYAGGGSAEIILDGQSIATAQFNTPSNGVHDVQASIFSIGDLANKTHTLKLVSNGGDVTIDAFIVKNAGGTYFADGIYTLSNLSDGKMLTCDGETVNKHNKSGSYNQQWFIEPIDDTYCHIINAYSGLRLGSNAAGNSAEEEAKWDGSQDWNIMESFRTPGYVVIENRKSGKYLQVDSAWPYDGAGLSPYEYSRQDHYEWKINDMPNGFITLQRNLNESVAEIVIDPSSPSKGRALINQLGASNQQKWKIENIGEDKFIIISAESGMLIGEKDGKPVMSDERDVERNQWKLIKGMQNAKEYYTLVNAESGNTLLNEKWSVVAVPESKTGTVRPFAYGLKVEGNVAAGKDILFSYTYKNISNAAESGSSYNVYMLDNVYDDITDRERIASGDISSDTAVAVTVPGEFTDSKALLFEVIPKSGDITGAKAYLAVTNPKKEELQKAQIIYSESFDGNITAEDVKSQKNGWYNGISGNGTRMDYVIRENGNSGRSFGFIAKDTWYANGWMGLDFASTGNEALANLNDKTYIGFDIMFTKPDNLDPNSTASVSLVGEGENNLFATLRLRDFSTDIIGLDDSKNENVKYNVATTLDDMYGKWYRVEMYVDVKSNSYAVKIDDRFITPRYGFFLPASSSTILGTASPVEIGRLKGIEFRQDWYSQEAGIWIDNIEVGSYKTADNTIYFNYISPKNDEIICGENNSFRAEIIKDGDAENAVAYIGLYKDNVLCQVKKYENMTFDNNVFETEFDFNIPDEEGAYTVRAFLWDDDMRPISDVYSTDIEAVKK